MCFMFAACWDIWASYLKYDEHLTIAEGLSLDGMAHATGMIKCFDICCLTAFVVPLIGFLHIVQTTQTGVNWITSSVLWSSNGSEV